MLFTNIQHDKKAFWKFYFFYLTILLVGAFLSEGWIQPDEHARVLEPAHWLAYGYASLPWEFSEKFPIVSFFLGYLHSWILVITKSFGLSGLTEAALLRAFTAIICSTRIIAFRLILPYFGFVTSNLSIYLVIFALNFYSPVILVHTSQQNWSATALTWAIYFLLKVSMPSGRGETENHPLVSWRDFAKRYTLKKLPIHALADRSNWDSILLGIMIALSVAFRPQSGVSAAALGLLCLWMVGIRRCIPVLVGIALGLTPIALVDWAYQGMPFQSTINYLRYALTDEEGGQVWGVDPWYYYFIDYFLVWFPPFSILLAAPLVVGLVRIPLLCITFLPFLIEHCILGHKDSRYFIPMLPVLFLANFSGFEWFKNYGWAWLRLFLRSSGWQKSLRAFWVLNLVLALLAISFPLNTSPRMYTKLRELKDAGRVPADIMYVGNTRSPASQFYIKHPEWEIPQMSFNEFIDKFRNQSDFRLPDMIAFYTISVSDLQQIETVCHQEYRSVPDWIADILAKYPKLLHRHRIHAIVRCRY